MTTYNDLLTRAVQLRGSSKRGPEFKHVDECAQATVNGTVFRVGFNEYGEACHYIAGALRSKKVFIDRLNAARQGAEYKTNARATALRQHMFSNR